VLLPAILTGIVTFLGARDVMNGNLQAGQLVAFFGYSMFLTTPLRTAIDYVIMSTRAYVGAGKVLRILAIQPTVSDPEDPVAWPVRVTKLEDRRSGLVLERGQLCALVTDLPDDADVFVNGVAIANYALDDVRSHIIVSEIEPRLFSGELRFELMPHGLVDDERIYQVLQATSSLDVLDALEDGLSTTVEERGRGFSGGQRQRLSLARAILTNAEVLVLVEPTSAVDTHTEGRIAAKLREIRHGHTTLLATTSPLLLEKMDLVYVLEDGRVSDHGSHDELVARSQRYRQIVLREDG
jgi:ABC-type multidrug transport system fused ATPase/permease subunit